jgi:hypothetical protein
MTTIQRISIPSPANGLMVFDVTTNSFWYFSTTWKEVSITRPGSFLLPYNGSFSDPGKIFSITNSNTTIGATAIYGRASGASSGITFNWTMGVWGDNSTGIGVVGSSNTMGVLGKTGLNDANGIGVFGENHSNTNAAIIGINDGSGGSVRGIFAGGAGKTGYGIIGETGTYGGWGTAGKFITYNVNDVTPTVHVVNNGSQVALNIETNNASNVTAALMVNHTGAGSLASFKKSGDEKMSISNNGNIITDGTVTVKTNKGIVRNSSATQLRVETPSVSISGPVVLASLESISVTVTFGASFSAAPVVYVGNVITDSYGTATYMTTYITNVTTTGCTLVVRNNTKDAIALLTSTWKLVTIGAE